MRGLETYNDPFKKSNVPEGCVLRPMQHDVKRISYADGVEVKLKNRRLYIKLENDTIMICTKKLINEISEIEKYKQGGFQIERNKIVTYFYKLSTEAFDEIIGAYCHLKRKSV